MSALARPIRPLTDPTRLLQTRVAELLQARRRADAARLAIRGVAIGGAAAALIGGIAQLTEFELGPFAAGAILVAIVAGLALVGWLRQPPPLQRTLEIDRLLALDERVTTALELAQRQHSGEGSPSTRRGYGQPKSPGGSMIEASSLARQQIADAATSLSLAATSSVYPLRIPRQAQVLAVAGLIVAVLPWLVPWPVVMRSYLPPSPVALAAQAEANRLDTVARALQSDPSPVDRQTRAQVAAQLEKAAAALRQSGGNSQNATRALQSAEQAMVAASPQTSQDAAQTLARIADAFNSNPMTQSATQALDAQDPGKAASAMAQIASNLGGMSAQQRGDLANTLQSASNAARSADTSAANQLQQAADAAKSGNADGMQQAAQALQQLGASSSAQRDVAQGRSELQASQQALSSASQQSGQAGQASANAASSANQSSPSQASNGGQSGAAQNGTSDPNASSGSANQSELSGSGTQPGSGSGQPGGGSGNGSQDHLGASSDLQGMAQRQVVVPSNGPIDPASIGLSNQTQAGSAGTAQVDYANVLPQYRSQALQNISGNEVPSGLKQVVKGYFDSLAPK